MKKRTRDLIIFCLFLIINFIAVSQNPNTDLEIRYRESKEKNILIFEEIWNAHEITIYPTQIKSRISKKEYIIINLGLIKHFSPEEIESRKELTKRIVFDQFLNKDNFNETKIIYKVKKENDTIAKEVIINESLYRMPVIQGCNKNLNLNEMKKCFTKTIKEIVVKNNHRGKYNYLNLEKKKTSCSVIFIIDKDSKIVVDTITHNNETIKKDFSKLFKNIIIKNPAYDNGKPVITSYSIPVSMLIE